MLGRDGLIRAGRDPRLHDPAEALLLERLHEPGEPARVAVDHGHDAVQQSALLPRRALERGRELPLEVVHEAHDVPPPRRTGSLWMRYFLAAR